MNETPIHKSARAVAQQWINYLSVSDQLPSPKFFNELNTLLKRILSLGEYKDFSKKSDEVVSKKLNEVAGW